MAEDTTNGMPEELHEPDQVQGEGSDERPKCYLILYNVSKKHNIGSILRCVSRWVFFEDVASPPKEKGSGNGTEFSLTQIFVTGYADVRLHSTWILCV
jgi:hypothetical protein